MNEIVTLKELIQSRYTHADAVATLNEVCFVTLFCYFHIVDLLTRLPYYNVMEKLRKQMFRK